MTNSKNPKNSIRCLRPASMWGNAWREALPTGNGKIGAAVFGGPINDTVMLTHGGLWWQGKVGVLPDVADKLKDTRKHMDADKPYDAENILTNALISKSYRPLTAYPLPLANLKVEMAVDKLVKDYYRQLNMENGEIGVSFKDGTTRFDRALFVSRTNDLVIYEITKTGAKNIDVKLSFEQHDKFNARTRDGISKLPEGIMTKYENYFLYFSQRSDNGNEFGCVARISHFGGTMTAGESGITLKGCEKVLVLIRPFIESNREKEWKQGKTDLAAIKLTYDKLLKEHTALHSKAFGVASLELDCLDKDLPCDELARRAAVDGEASPALLEKLHAYSTFLMISGAGEGLRPLSSYGIWCGDYKGEHAQINADGSIQTIYAGTMQVGLHDHMLALFGYYENLLDDLKKNAARLYLCRGIFIPPVMAHGTGLLGSVEPEAIHTIYIAGWIACLMYDYYLYTLDDKFLKTRAIPFMKEVATFFEEFFKVRSDSYYDSCPSYAGSTPGNYAHGGTQELRIARGSTIDFAIAKELLTNLIDGSKIANLNKGDIEKWQHMLTKIPPLVHNNDGTISEYSDIRYHDNPKSASLTRYYSVYPGLDNVDNAEVAKAFLLTYRKQLETSWSGQNTLSLVRGASLLARLGDGEGAMSNINAVTRGMLMDNLVTSAYDRRGYGIGAADGWSRYTLEGNMGIAAAINEMLLQSTPNCIKILPALPQDLNKGEISDMSTRTGVIVSLSWDMRKGTITARLKSKKARSIDVLLPPNVTKYKKISTEKFSPEQRKITELPLPAGKVVTLDLRL